MGTLSIVVEWGSTVRQVSQCCVCCASSVLSHGVWWWEYWSHILDLTSLQAPLLPHKKPLETLHVILISVSPASGDDSSSHIGPSVADCCCAPPGRSGISVGEQVLQWIKLDHVSVIKSGQIEQPSKFMCNVRGSEDNYTNLCIYWHLNLLGDGQSLLKTQPVHRWWLLTAEEKRCDWGSILDVIVRTPKQVSWPSSLQKRKEKRLSCLWHCLCLLCLWAAFRNHCFDGSGGDKNK